MWSPLALPRPVPIPGLVLKGHDNPGRDYPRICHINYMYTHIHMFSRF
jgi:hypothetical protein